LSSKPLEQRLPGVGRVAQAKFGTGIRIDAAVLDVAFGARVVRQILLEKPRRAQHEFMQVGSAGFSLSLRLARQFEPGALRQIRHGVEEFHFFVLHEKADDRAVRAAAKAVIKLLLGTNRK